ncbi:DUF1876 domain-containing protein [Kribbella sp. NBC_00889]|uniref:DUF1876 domain-containing protein n=1 Tax=Kribbella sp. NBC_00889 TaxID=2975974 RepID=UPI003864C5DE|nr:DUF1876 domain-containing protein [Kribbella sp. NBC_00889]
MIASRHWSVEIFIDEHEDERTTHAEARLHTNDKTHLIGRGTARRNPNDTDIAEIGDELAVARALSSLAHALLDAATSDIEQITHEHIHLQG